MPSQPRRGDADQDNPAWLSSVLARFDEVFRVPVDDDHSIVTSAEMPDLDAAADLATPEVVADLVGLTCLADSDRLPRAGIACGARARPVMRS